MIRKGSINFYPSLPVAQSTVVPSSQDSILLKLPHILPILWFSGIPASAATAPHIVLVGDSTVTDNAGYVPFGHLVAEEMKKAAPALAPFILDEPHDPNPRSAAKDFGAVVSLDDSGILPSTPTN